MNVNPNKPYGRIKLSSSLPLDATDEQIDRLAIMGVPYAFSGSVNLTEKYDELARLKERCAKRGVTLYNASNFSISKNKSIILGLEDRDDHIAEVAKTMEMFSKLDLVSMTFTWEVDKMQSTAWVQTRGGAPSRAVDTRKMAKWPVNHGRVYEKDELWENFTYYMKAIIPTAESTGVRMALHPNDPPMPMIGGVASLITSRDDYRKAFQIANSKMLGMEFCCGCWLEGGDNFGDIQAAFKEFQEDGRIIITHFRNVSSTMPYFEEAFIDDGYYDMYKLMRCFYECDYDGSLVLDHTPPFTVMEGRDIEQNGSHYVQAEKGWHEAYAYAIGYIKALMTTASSEVFGQH